MTDEQWNVFCKFKNEFREKILEWNEFSQELLVLQKFAAKKAKTPDYSFENAIVFNSDLEKINSSDEIRLIIIGDNPGKDEQLSKNQKYLVGLAGKIADGFFKKHSEFNVDFRKNAIILNKTPIHSAKTSQLKTILKEGRKEIQDLFNETQIWMAKKTAELHIELCKNSGNSGISPELWLVGYSELKPKGIFCEYKNVLQDSYKNHPEWEKVFVFQHFSMNRFSIDLNNFSKNQKDSSLKENLYKLGSIHKAEFFLQ